MERLKAYLHLWELGSASSIQLVTELAAFVSERSGGVDVVVLKSSYDHVAMCCPGEKCLC